MFNSRLKVSISLEIFNPGPSEFPTKIGVWWVARLKISSSLEIFKILNFFKIWALREVAWFRSEGYSEILEHFQCGKKRRSKLGNPTNEDC